MTAKIATVTIAQFELSNDEIAVLESAYRLIDGILSALGQGETIVSKDTGECITCEELERVKGILSGLVENEGVEWEVE